MIKWSISASLLAQIFDEMDTNLGGKLMTTEDLWRVGLTGSNSIFLAFVLIACYIFINKRIALNVFYLLLFGITLNIYLKEIWQVPLNPGVNSNTYAFPSGHMNSATLVYLSLCLHLRRTWMYLFAIMMLSTAAISIEHFHYHTWPDLLGGFCIGGIIAISYWYISKHLKLQPSQYGVIFLCAQVGILSLLLPFIPRFFWAWHFVFLNLGVNLGLFLFDKPSKLGNSSIIMLSIIFCASVMRHWNADLAIHVILQDGTVYFLCGTFFAFIAPFLEHCRNIMHRK